MGARGPAALPAQIHRLRGNPAKKTEEELNAGICPTVKLPDPPPNMGAAARKEWFRVGKQLEVLGAVSEMDLSHFAMYCNAWALWLTTLKEIKKFGNNLVDDECMRWLKIQDNAAMMVKRFGGEFGLSPASRNRPQVLSKKKDVSKEDPKAKYFG